MAFTWHFYTGSHIINPVGRRCHRGPMIDVELVMSKQFVHLADYNTLRVRLLENITSTDARAVQTREVVLRTLNSLLGPMFARMASQKSTLQTLICEKLDSVTIDTALLDLRPFYQGAAKALVNHRVPEQQVALLTAALTSHSPVMRVAGMCAVILLFSFIEMDLSNG